MATLVLTDLGGGDVAFNVIDERGWRDIARLRRQHELARDFMDAAGRLVDGWLGNADARILATGSMQRGVVEIVGRKFRGIPITRMLYIEP